MTNNGLFRKLVHRARWSVAMGVATAVIGAIMIVYPLATAAVSTVFLGSALMVAAVAQFVFAFTSPTVGRFVLKLLLAVLYAAAGAALAFLPLAGVVSLTFFLGVSLFLDAGLETGLAFATPAGAGRGAFLVSALCSLVAGFLILSQWPFSAGWAIGTLVGVGVCVNGITRAVVSGQVEAELRHLQPSPKAA
jgi:uncharacterized membrane protein HdeD (DUF308 family)